MATKFYNPTPGFGPVKLADTFGPNVRPGGHTGWDNRAPWRFPIRPAAPGKVYAIPVENLTLPKDERGCGHGVRIRHDATATSSYCHLAEPTTLRVGDVVDYDTILGYVGTSGNASYPHLHHSHERNGIRVDPASVLEGTGLIRDPWPGLTIPPPPTVLDRVTVDRPRLRRGAEGRAVSDLQALLNIAASAGLTVDGKFGPLTETAVQGFQSSHGLTADGIVGPLTWTALLDY